MDSPILVFGGQGQLGRALSALGKDGQVVALSRQEADLTDRQAVGAALDSHRPAVVINCAVFQSVDRCEAEPSAAFQVNALAAGMLAIDCAERDLRLVHVSTDYVFDGAKAAPYTEDDCPRPLGVYAASKLAGEHLVQSPSERHCVVRTSSVYGRAEAGHGTLPFVERMLERARAGETTRVVEDQVVSPTYAEDLAVALLQLAGRDVGGIVHLAGSTPCSWYQLARYVFELAGRVDLLSATTAEKFGAPAPRPAYSALGSVRLAQLGMEPLPGWEDALKRYFEAAHPELM